MTKGASTGAPFVRFGNCSIKTDSLFFWICNPKAMNISIFNTKSKRKGVPLGAPFVILERSQNCLFEKE